MAFKHGFGLSKPAFVALGARSWSLTSHVYSDKPGRLQCLSRQLGQEARCVRWYSDRCPVYTDHPSHLIFSDAYHSGGQPYWSYNPGARALYGHEPKSTSPEEVSFKEESSSNRVILVGPLRSLCYGASRLAPSLPGPLEKPREGIEGRQQLLCHTVFRLKNDQGNRKRY